MNRFFKIIPACLTFLSFYSFANQSLIDAYVCHDCSLSEARALAKTKYVRQSCGAKDLNGGPGTGDSPKVCNSTNMLIAVLNPQERKSWIFNVNAPFSTEHFMDVTPSASSISSDERVAADLFFDFYDDMLDVTNGNLIAIDPSAFDSFKVSSASTSNSEPAPMANTSGANTSACKVAKDYFGSQAKQDNVEGLVERELTQRLNARPYILNQNIAFTVGGFKVTYGSVGFNVKWEAKENPIFLSIGDANTKLVFNVEFNSSVAFGQGNFQINMYLDRDASKIDGRRIDRAFLNGTINDHDTTTSDYPCLREIAKHVADKAPWGGYQEGASSNVLAAASFEGEELTSYCVRTVRLRTCSTGQYEPTCTNTEYSFPDACF